MNLTEKKLAHIKHLALRAAVEAITPHYLTQCFIKKPKTKHIGALDSAVLDSYAEVLAELDYPHVNATAYNARIALIQEARAMVYGKKEGV